MARGLHIFVALFASIVAANAALSPFAIALLEGLGKGAPPPKDSLLSFVPPALKSLLPDAVKEQLAQLDTSDLLAVKQIAKKYPIYDDLQQVLNELEDKSPVLAKLVKKALGLGKSKLAEILAELIPESKSFFKDLGEQGKAALKKVVETYENLSDEAKENLKDTFPLAAKVLEDPTFQKVANKVIYS
ncbi:fatty acid retinoid binding protein [Aphelenchoides avenae]|nr:fatty acid retinoid binding protein [Aphelenchus avenae]